jgi:16S rRNA processing protein RimM
MNYKGFTGIGYIKKTFGYKGELLIKIKDADYPENIENLESVFFETENQLVPFFISESSYRDDSSVVAKFEDIDNSTKAQRYCGCRLFLTDKTAETLFDKNKLEFLIADFEIIDGKFGSLGKPEEIVKMPQQLLLRLKVKGREVLIPLVEQLIIKIDKKKKQIFINSPEGLIDNYLDV